MAASPGSKRVGGVYFEIEGDSSDFKRELRQTETQAKRTGNVIKGEFRKTEVAAAAAQKRISSVSTSLIAMAAAAGLGIGQSISILKDFGQAMSTVQAVTGATEAQMVALTAQARLLGATTRFSATQAAEGMIFLARAGFNTDQVLGSIEGTLQLAQAGALDLASAADIASNVLQGMRLPVSETARVVDVLAKAANSSNTNVQQLGDALKYVAPIAAGLNVSIEDTVAAIGALSDAGLQGETAGTGLRKVLISLEKQTPQGEKILKKYGLTMADVSVQANGMIPALQRLADAGIDTADAMTLFGLHGGGPAIQVLVDSMEKLNRQADALGKAGGTVESVARIMDENLNGAILAAISAMQELVLALGEAGATPALVSAFNGLANLFRTVAKNADIVGVAIIAMTTRAMIPLVISTVPGVVGALRTLIASLVGVQTQAAKTSTATALLGGPLTLVIAAAAAAYLYLARSVVTVDEALDNANSTLSKFNKAQTDLEEDTRKLEKAQKDYADAVREGGRAAIDAAALEVNAINTRIAKNEELKNSYRQLLEAQLAQASAAVQNAERSLLRLTGVKRNENAGVDQLGQPLVETFGSAEARQRAAAVQLRAQIDEAIRTGRTLTEQESKFLEASAQLAQQQLDLAGLKDALSALDNPVAPAGSPQGAIPTDPTDSAASPGSTQNEVNLGLLTQLERAHALDLARAQGNDELVSILEKQEEIIARTADYMDTGLLTKEQARAKAAAEVTAEYEAQADAAKRTSDFEALIADLNTQADANAQVAADQAASEQAVKDAFQQSISQALNDAIRTGDWGSAVRDVFADAVSRGLSDAISDFATELVNLIGGALKGSGGGGIGSFFASLFSFGGAKAAGGSVNAGDRYLIGERGPEMFVPNQAGVIVPNSMLNPNTDTSSVRAGGSAQMNFIVQGNITEEVFPRVQQMFADFARQVPGMVDARVVDRKKRGAY